MTKAEMPVEVVLVDDDEDLRNATAQLLTLAGFAVRPFPAAEPALRDIAADDPAIVVTDVRMPGLSGIDLFRELRARDAELPVILMTGHGDVPMAVEALKSGAWDFLSKPFDPDVLLAAVLRAAAARRLVLDNRRLRQAADAAGAQELVGESAAIRRLRGLIPVLADADVDVLLAGETGTGKELFARLIHRAGRRSRHRFQMLDCATLPPALLDGELFARIGLIARADRGTLLLDNLDRATPALHDRLERFAETRALDGHGREPDTVDVRIFAAVGTANALPPTLYHRLAGVPLTMPALADRREDIPILFLHLLARSAAHLRTPLPDVGDLPHRLATRDWPGNVRELEKFAERLCLGIEPEMAADGEPGSLPERMNRFERTAIEDAIARSNGEIAAAIQLLGIPRKTFYYRVAKLDIDLRSLRTAGRKA
jgi:two-component system C4-dicarboxylate transport response regulator DctD